jgi:hypothetical protein
VVLLALPKLESGFSLFIGFQPGSISSTVEGNFLDKKCEAIQGIIFAFLRAFLKGVRRNEDVF